MYPYRWCFSVLKNDTDLGKQARVYMDAGDLVPWRIDYKMFDEINKHPDTNGILFDGWRTIPNRSLDEFSINL
jgi:adenylate kinase